MCGRILNASLLPVERLPNSPVSLSWPVRSLWRNSASSFRHSSFSMIGYPFLIWFRPAMQLTKGNNRKADEHFNLLADITWGVQRWMPPLEIIAKQSWSLSAPCVRLTVLRAKGSFTEVDCLEA